MPKPENHSCGNSGAAQCPFYRARSEREVHCEGLLPESIAISRFRSRTDCKQQLSIFCCGRFQYCEMYRALMAEKYSDTED